MKKVLVLILGIAMLFMLTACSGFTFNLGDGFQVKIGDGGNGSAINGDVVACADEFCAVE